MKLIVLFVALFAVSHAKEGFGPGEQDWGYVDVRKNAHMFWWLYYTTADVPNFTDRPLIIWLQGGPGASSTGYGNFAELGPLDLYLNERNFTWVKDANVLFIDNPVGSGFSYVDSIFGYTTTNLQIAEDLVTFMKGFYDQLPEFKTVPLYITAESYGGKMAAEFALLLDQEIKNGMECNLIGIGLGDSWISPVDSVNTWAPYLLHVGAVDQAGYDAIMQGALATEKYIQEGKWDEATAAWGYTEIIIMNVAHNIDFYNILKKIPALGIYLKNRDQPLFKPGARVDEDAILDELMNGEVKTALGLEATWGAQSSHTFSYLKEDFMKPVIDIVERILDETDIKVAVFSGQLDLIVDTPGTVLWVDNLKWKQSDQWATAVRTALVVDQYNEGYVKKVGNLALYWVNRSGHMVPADNPYAMDYILRELTDDYAGRKQIKN